MPIAPDIFRLDTDTQGWAYTKSAGSDTLLKAAQILRTLADVLDNRPGGGHENTLH